MLGRIERARLGMLAHMDASAKALFTALAALALILTLLAGACGDAAQSPTPTLAPPTPTPTPTPINPQAIVDESAAAMAALDSFRFALTHNNDGGTPLTLGMLLTDASGSVGVPDRVALDFNGVSAGRFAVSGSVIAVGEDVYMTNPLTGDWHQVGGDASPLNFFNPAQGIADIMAQMRDATLVSHDAAAYRIDGRLPAECAGVCCSARRRMRAWCAPRSRSTSLACI